VRERVERLQGSIAVESAEGRGTTFRLVVPMTLSTFRGVTVRAGEDLFVVPTLAIERVVRVEAQAVRTIEGRPAIEAGGGHIPLVRLADVLELPPAPPRPSQKDRLIALILGAGAARVAFEVDEAQGDQEVLVKPLGRCLQRVRNVSAATLLGDGRIAPILNVQDLLKSAARTVRPPEALQDEAPVLVQKSVLIAEDSITARGLLKNILEAAGYRVRTTVDGVDAWAALKLESFDVVVSDVEMPRMNGFDLTARIRSDRALSELPVVLLTALESREDRERGVEVGANAYSRKGDFDQRVLLEVLRRLA
jgi:two-component system chemotaxis sensor kinase CheA